MSPLGRRGDWVVSVVNHRKPPVPSRAGGFRLAASSVEAREVQVQDVAVRPQTAAVERRCTSRWIERTGGHRRDEHRDAPTRVEPVHMAADELDAPGVGPGFPREEPRTHVRWQVTLGEGLGAALVPHGAGTSTSNHRAASVAVPARATSAHCAWREQNVRLKSITAWGMRPAAPSIGTAVIGDGRTGLGASGTEQRFRQESRS